MFVTDTKPQKSPEQEKWIMPDSPKDEVLRRRALRQNTLRGQSQYQREKRKTDVGGNIPLERSLPEHRALPFNLEDPDPDEASTAGKQ